MPETAQAITDYERAHSASQNLVDNTYAEQWTTATPCTEWDVRALVNHLLGGDRMFAQIVRGEFASIEEARAWRVQQGDFLGDDPSAAFRAARDEVVDAFSQPGVLERTFPSPMGDRPGAFVAAIRTSEHIVHGWDLAMATGQRTDGLPSDLVEQAFASYQRALADGRSPAHFGAEQPVAGDAPTIDRLAAFLGRSVPARV